MNSHPSMQFEMSFKHLVFKLFTKQNIWKINLDHHHGQCRQTFFSDDGDSGAGGDGDNNYNFLYANSGPGVMWGPLVQCL